MGVDGSMRRMGVDGPPRPKPQGAMRPDQAAVGVAPSSNSIGLAD